VDLLHPDGEFIEAERAIMVSVHLREQCLWIGGGGALGPGQLRPLRAGRRPILRPGPLGVRAHPTRPFAPCPRHERRSGLKGFFHLVKGQLLVAVLVGFLEPGFERLRRPGRDFVGRDGAIVILVEPVEERVGIARCGSLRLFGPCPQR
jgi:hypothetical protein